MFFVQRILIVIIMVVTTDFGLQWSLTQMVLLVNAVYLFETAPYFEPIDSIPDYFNMVVVILLSILQTTCSAWASNASIRYYNGMAFDCLLGLSFVMNFGFVVGIAVKPAILKVKQFLFRRKNKAAMKKKAEEF